MMSKPFNILHLSDLHFSKSNRHDVRMIVDEIKVGMRELSSTTLQPNIVVFSGDLVNDADEKDVYSVLHDEVLEPIAEATRTPLSRFVFTPGNHDISRDATRKNLNTLVGIEQNCKSRDGLNRNYLDGNIHGLAYEKSRAYFDLIEYIYQHPLSSADAMMHTQSFEELKVDVLSLNTAWFSWGGQHGRNDLRNLLLPEQAVYDGLKRLNAKHTHILVTHHPLNWLTEFAESDARNVLSSHPQIHLFGHMHEPSPSHLTSLRGRSLQIQAGALYAGRNRYIGYSLTRYEPSTGHAAVHLFAHSEARRIFHPAVQLAPQGVFSTSPEASRFFLNEHPTIDDRQLHCWLANHVTPYARKHFDVGVGDRRLSQVFVPPPLVTEFDYSAPESNIDRSLKPRRIEIEFDKALVDKNNLIVYGKPEYGKTAFLQQLILQTLNTQNVEARPVVPVFIPFLDIKRGDNRILRAVRNSLPVTAPPVSVQHLLGAGYMTICVDDVDFDQQQSMDVLREFIKEYPLNRYVLTSAQSELSRFEAVAKPDLSVSFQSLFIQPFTRKRMRSLVGKWDCDGRYDQNDVLDRVMNELIRINVPVTAVNGTILLTIYENQAHFRAINRAVLVENFIEALLEKWSPGHAERRTFDFTNQRHILAHLASWMAQSDQYVVSQPALNDLFQSYLDEVGLRNDPKTLIADFLQARVLEMRLDGCISFRYRAFLEYFIASQMAINEEFSKWVMENDRYLSFINEIQYYAGINRADRKIIEIVASRFTDIMKAAYTELQWTPDVRSLEDFTLPVEGVETDDMVTQFERQMGSPPLTADEKDAVLESDLPEDVERRQEVFRPSITDIGHRLLLAISLYSGLVRNLELLSDASKRQHLKIVLEAWGQFLMASLQIVPMLAKHRRLKVNGVNYEVLVPRHFTEAEVARTIYVAMPSSLGQMIWSTLGTEKLDRQLTEPTLEQANDPALIKMLRANLCADLKIGSWWESYKDFANQYRKSNYLLNAVSWKLRELHMMGDVPKRAALEFKKVTAEILTSMRRTDHRDAVATRGLEMQRLDKADVMRRIKASKAD